MFERIKAIIAAAYPLPLVQVMHPAKPTINPPKRCGEQRLGPNQLKWLEERFQFYRIHRKQAEAPVGLAVIVPHERGGA